MMSGRSTLLATAREEAEEPFLRGAVVVRHDDERGIDADLRRVLRQRQRLVDVVRARRRDEGDAPADGALAEVEHPAAFGERERARLARRPGHGNAVAAAGDLPINQAFEGLFVNCARVDRTA